MSERIFVAGHNGMVGRALVRNLRETSDCLIITRSRSELDLLSYQQVSEFLNANQIDKIYLAAARVGGIYANNTFPADFIYENLQVAINIIDAAHRANIQQLIFLGSSCIYPRLAEQPMKETSLLTGVLEPTNEPYAIAKIAGIKMCESYNRQFSRDYRCVMPTNLYGSHDNFHLKNSHVAPGLLRRFHEAKISNDDHIDIWGSGNARRELMYVDEMASACVHVMNLPAKKYAHCTDPMVSHVNVGTGVDCTIRELAEEIADITEFKGSIMFDHNKPDGAPQKLLDVSRLRELGWQSDISLRSGLKMTYEWWLENQNNLRT